VPFSGTSLRRLLDERGKRREALASEINKSFASIAGYESGRIAPPLSVIEDIAHALDVDVAALIDDPPCIGGVA
jgi:transcriptional regulator with XRE-family HTH domain